MKIEKHAQSSERILDLEVRCPGLLMKLRFSELSRNKRNDDQLATPRGPGDWWLYRAGQRLLTAWQIGPEPVCSANEINQIVTQLRWENNMVGGRKDVSAWEYTGLIVFWKIIFWMGFYECSSILNTLSTECFYILLRHFPPTSSFPLNLEKRFICGENNQWERKWSYSQIHRPTLIKNR